jgi:predicted nucleic acid-binding OB-fold protein
LEQPKIHNRTHREKPYVCGICKTHFTQLSSVQKHINVPHQKITNIQSGNTSINNDTDEADTAMKEIIDCTQQA